MVGIFGDLLMKRILLVTEDFNEMTFLETLLKKLGFDAMGIQNPAQASDKALTINPEMLILSDFIKGQSTHELLETLVSYRPNMFVILMKTDLKTTNLHVAEFVNRAVKSPVDPVDFIQSICDVANLNAETLLEKFYKLGLFKGGSQHAEPITVSGKIKPPSDTQFIKSLKSPIQEKNAIARKKRFAEQVKTLSEPKSEKIDPKVAHKEALEYRARTNDVEIQKIDEQRQSFVKALFKK
jgi:hypothetical protein